VRQWSTMLTGVAVSSSVLTIAVLSADRLLAVRRPLSFSVYRASRHAWIIVAGVWAASFAVSAPLLGVRRLRTVDLGFGTQNKFDFCHEANHCHISRVIIHCLKTEKPRNVSSSSSSSSSSSYIYDAPITKRT